MTPLEFLAVVLPSAGNGFYCAAELSTRKKEHWYSLDVLGLEPPINRWDASNRDIYFALATFEEYGNREAVNARYIKSLFIDMDGYESKKAAAQALQAFSAEVGLDLLGTPYIVGSGGGIHVYWPFTEDVTIERWKPVAERLKRLCKQQDMKIDMTVTADAARVLRVPGTRNHKKKYPAPRPVQILAEGDTFSFEDLESVITSALKTPVPVSTAPAAPPLALAGKKPTTSVTPSVLAPLVQNSVTKFKNIIVKTKAGKGCAQLQHYVENAEDDGMEPLWRGWLSIAQKCEDGGKAAVWLSNLHPYDHERMNRKLAEIKGPYPCIKFDSENPGLCTNCPHWGKITNPLALGREIAVVTESSFVEVDNDSQEEPLQVLRPEPPRGYAYGKNGGVFMERTDEDSDGNEIKRSVMLCAYDFFPVELLNNNGIHEVHMVAIRNKKVQNITLPQKCIATKDETIKHLASKNIMASFGSGNDKNFYEYIRASIEKLSIERDPIKLPSSYGWQDDGTFVFAGRIYKANTAPMVVPMNGLENIVANTQPTGTLENWQKIVNMMIRRKLWDQLAILLLGAGAPLMRFTGLYGMTAHCTSRGSGTGKTLALDLAASVWGHPIHYRTGAGTSAVAMQQRLGLLRSMPLITDEITTNNRKDFEWFPAFLFSMSEGRGKERMESGANKERLNLSIWATLAIMSSNRNSLDYLAGERLHSSEGELRRLLEFSFDEKLKWTPEEIELIKSLQQNYAVVGERLAQYMVDNMGDLRTLVPQTVQQMYAHYSAPNDERFWMAGIACGVCAGLLFNSQHLGVADIPMEEILNAYGRSVDMMRSAITGSVITASDILNNFIQENQGKFVVVKMGTKAGPLAHFHDGSVVGKNTARSEVMGRIEMRDDGYIDLFLEDRLIRGYCSNRSFSFSNWKREIQQDYMVRFHKKKDMLSRTDAPPMRVAATQITMKADDEDLALQPPPPLSLVKAA